MIGGVILAVTPRCGGGKSETDKKSVGAVQEYDRTKADEQQLDTVSDETGKRYIKDVTFEPELIRANSEITLNLETDGSIPSAFRVVYIFWKNGENIQEGDANMSEEYAYEKGDLFTGEVRLMEGDVIVERKRTEMREVVNSRPVIENVELPEFKGFGIYRFKVTVSDIDRDPVTLRVEGENLPDGFSVDHEYSEVVYQMDEAPPEILKFIIAADDGSGGIDKKQVTINFPRGPKESGSGEAS